MRIAAAALQFFYQCVLSRDRRIFPIVRSPDRQRLPVVLSFGWLHRQTLLSVPLLFHAAAPTPQAPLHRRCPRCGQLALKIIARLRHPRPP
jgi:hypothetical protein